MSLSISGQVGPAVVADGVSTQPIRQGKSGEVVVQELHGRFYEANARGNIYSGGMTLTSISNATFTSATLGATCTPITGVWNPIGSGYNMVIMQASLAVTLTALIATGGGPYVWATGLSSVLLTLGTTPFNRKTGIAAGSVGKDMSGIALTGLTPNIVVRFGSALGGGSYSNASFTATAVGAQAMLNGYVENFDGAFIVPPGGVAALLATTTPVAHSAASSIMWEEVPI